MAIMSDSHYLPVRSSEDTEPESRPHEDLLSASSTSSTHYKLPSTYSITFDLFAVRFLSTILALVAFIILVIDGDEEFIAADIFLMFIIILNILIIAHHFASNLFVVTVEVRSAPWKANLGSTGKPKISTYLDIGLALITFLCLLIGFFVKRYGGAWKAAVTIGYIVVVLQILLAVPSLESKRLTFTAKLTDATAKALGANKLPIDEQSTAVLGGVDSGFARRRTTDSEEAGLSPEGLV